MGTHHAMRAGLDTPTSDEAGSARNAPAPDKQDQQTGSHFASDDGNGKALANAACRCRAGQSCATCTAFRGILDRVADRHAERVARQIEARNIAAMMARHQAATRRRPVRDLPRRLPFDLDALADAVALRLGAPT